VLVHRTLRRPVIRGPRRAGDGDLQERFDRSVWVDTRIVDGGCAPSAQAAAVETPTPQPGARLLVEGGALAVSSSPQSSASSFDPALSAIAVPERSDLVRTTTGVVYNAPAEFTLASKTPATRTEVESARPEVVAADAATTVPQFDESASASSSIPGAGQSSNMDAAALFGVDVSPAQSSTNDHASIPVGDDPQVTIISGLIFGVVLAGAGRVEPAAAGRASPLPLRDVAWQFLRK